MKICKVMEGFGIYLSEVIARYEESGMSSHSEEFSLRYVYEDKNQQAIVKDYKICRRRTAKSFSGNRNGGSRTTSQKETDALQFHIEFFSEGKWNVRNLFIAQVTHFNGKLIDHRY